MICDAHVHVGTSGFGDIPPEASPLFLTDLLRKCRVGEFIFSSLSAQFGATLEVLEREAQETKDSFGDGAHAFLWLTGRLYDIDPDLKTLDSGLWEGLKLHGKETPWTNERPRQLERIVAICEERGIPIQFHAGEDEGCRPHDLLPFVSRHPRLRADFAHCRPLDDAIYCLRECPWLFADTSFMSPENYEKLASEHVVDRVIFGTDYPTHVQFYDGTADELYRNDLEGAYEYGYSKAVMSGNFSRFLRG